MFKINIITAFPEVFPGSLDVSILAKARKKKIWDLNIVDLKKFSSQTKSMDDKPFGGGPGMVIRADVLQNAYEKAKIFFEDYNFENVEKIMLTPDGEEFNHSIAEALTKKKGLLIICGRYDRLCPIEVHREMESLIKYSTLEIIPDAAHLPTLEQPSYLNKILKEWLLQ